MDYVKRKIQELANEFMFEGKVIILYGARQTGKTSLVRQLVDASGQSVIWYNADEPDVAESLTGQNSSILKSLMGEHKIVVIDEAQRIKNIGITLKLIADNFPEYQVIATGSSSFDLSNDINEPLTGRKWEFLLPPFATEELAGHSNLLLESRLLHHRLIYGMYPEPAIRTKISKRVVKELAKSYLYKDLFAYDGIRNSEKLQKLLKALALQLGAEVSYQELGQLAQMDSKTVERYLDLLEQSFIIFRLNSFSRNLRTELKKAKKIYFWDNGIRNAVLGNFYPIDKRTDHGALWENFIVSERYKYLFNNDMDADLYFWRTHLQQEIDLLEVTHDQIKAFEIKWNPKAKAKLSKSFTNAYPDAVFHVIHPKNYMDFLISGLEQ